MELTKKIGSRISAAIQFEEEDTTSTIELDSHADSAVVGRAARILERTGKVVNVSGFTDKLGKPLRVEVVHAALVYDCHVTGKVYLCIIRNALHVPEMKECLVHPLMMRLVGIEVDECPKFLARHPSIMNHSIYFPDKELRIPMHLKV